MSKRCRMLLADYDNATLYNDSIMAEVIKRFEKEDAIVIYMSDHGEEAFGNGMEIFGRNHSAVIDFRLAHDGEDHTLQTASIVGGIEIHGACCRVAEMVFTLFQNECIAPSHTVDDGHNLGCAVGLALRVQYVIAAQCGL